MSGGGAVLVADDDPEAATADDAQGVLVGVVVADVDRQHARLVEVQLLEQELEGPTLVPVEVGS